MNTRVFVIARRVFVPTKQSPSRCKGLLRRRGVYAEAIEALLLAMTWKEVDNDR